MEVSGNGTDDSRHGSSMACLLVDGSSLRQTENGKARLRISGAVPDQSTYYLSGAMLSFPQEPQVPFPSVSSHLPSSSTLVSHIETAMTSSTKILPPEELLQYHPDFPVLICRTCRYAIQPTGIARHLKEIHHIYRSQRRPYIEYASRFDLAKPEAIKTAKINHFPVRHLPVLNGLQCLGMESCSYLCVSTKRMQNHWLTVHGRHGDPANKDWRPAALQTFFRGNLLRYFTSQEV